MIVTLPVAALLWLVAPTVEPAPPPPAPPSHHSIDLGLLVSLSQPSLVLGVDQDVAVHVTLPQAAQGPLGKVTLKSSTGDVIDLARDNDRAMSARWVLPSRRFPQGAVLVASTEDGRLGALCVPLPAVASPAFHTDPGAEVTLTVAGRVFGPKRANAQGDVRVPVVVPPGVPMALATSKNEHGKTAEETMDLGHPPFARVLIWAPPTTTLGIPTQAWVFALDSAARPAAHGSLSLRWIAKTQTGGTTPPRWAVPLEGGPGWTRFLFEPPTAPPNGKVTLQAFDEPATRVAKAAADESPPRAEAELTVLAGPPARYVMIPNRSHIAVGTAQTLTVVVRAEDAFGNPTSALGVKLYVDGAPANNVTELDGPVRLVVPAPRTRVRPPRLRIEAIGKHAYAIHEVVVDGVASPVSEPNEERVPYDGALMLRAGSVWSRDAGTGMAAWLEGAFAFRRMQGWPPNLFITATVGYLGRTRALSSSEGLSRLAMHAVPTLVGVAWHLQPWRGVDTSLGVATGGARVELQTKTLGEVTTGGAWVLALRVCGEVALGTGAYQLALGLSYAQIPGTQLSSQDVLRGNLGGWDLGMGGRFRW